MNLHRVLEGKFVQYPGAINLGGDRVWLFPGAVVDLDDEFTAQAIRGQEYKLVADPKAGEPTRLTNQQMISLHATFEKQRRPPPKPEPSTEELAVVATIAAPDPLPKKQPKPA